MVRDMDAERARQWASFVFEENDHEYVPVQLTDPMDHERCFLEIRYLKIFAVEFYASGQPLYADESPSGPSGPSVPERQRALRKFDELVRARPEWPTLQVELDRRRPRYLEAARAAEGDERRDVVLGVGEAFAQLLPGTSASRESIRFVGLVCFNEFMKYVRVQ